MTYETVTLVRCPVHGELVAINLFRELLGRCSECCSEAARATTEIEKEAA